jgi:hypothetical protein
LGTEKAAYLRTRLRACRSGAAERRVALGLGQRSLCAERPRRRESGAS